MTGAVPYLCLALRAAWDAEREEWYFSVVDVVGVLTDQSTPRGASTYWAVLKKRLKEEGADQLLTNCKQLKMTAADGKKRLTDVADTERPRGLKENRGVSRPLKCDRQKHAPQGYVYPRRVPMGADSRPGHAPRGGDDPVRGVSGPGKAAGVPLPRHFSCKCGNKMITWFREGRLSCCMIMTWRGDGRWRRAAIPAGKTKRC